MAVRSFLLAVSAVAICAAQTTITVQPASPVPSIAVGSSAQVTLGSVTTGTAGVSFTLNSLDPNAWLATSGSCSTQINSTLLQTPAQINVCISPNMPAGMHYLFFSTVNNSGQITYFALPLDVTSTAATIGLNSSSVSITAPTTTGSLTATAATGTTISSAVVSNGQPGVGNWLSTSTNCAGVTTCNVTLTVTPGNLVSPQAGTVYLAKVSFTSSDGTVSEAEVQYTYQPTNETGITITSPSSFTGSINQAFSATLTAKGGTPPYTWTATNLPSGLSISSAGVISGTVTTANTYAATVKATDSLGGTQTQTVTLTFQNAATAVPTQIFPHMAADTLWQTNFLIINPTSAPVAFTLKLHPDSGTTVAIAGQGSVSEITGTVPARGTVSYTTAATTDSDGWAELDSASALSGVAVFSEPTSQASVLLSSPATTFTIPYGGPTGISDGVAIADADPANAARVTCQAYDNNGNTIGSTFTLTNLAASTHTAFLLQQVVTGLPANVNGQLACTSTAAVGVVALRATATTTSTLPVILGQ